MISIIIPTLNEEKLIADTLKRLKSGLSLPHEIIISDGKSTDKTADLARQYADKVIVHNLPHRQTIAEGRTAGGNAASGEFLIFLDADCRVDDPNTFFRMAVSAFEKDPKLVAQAAWIRVFPENESATDKVMWSIYNSINWFLNLVGFGVCPGEMQMMRKETFLKVGGYRKDLVAGEDNDMFHRLSKLGRVRLNPHLRVYHSGRHGHYWGWPKMLFIWSVNTLSIIFRNKSYYKEWSVIR